MSKRPMTVAQAGRKGGEARARKLTKERLIEIARQGYKASPLSVKHKQCQMEENSENKEK
jgi:general stress protein YciG